MATRRLVWIDAADGDLRAYAPASAVVVVAADGTYQTAPLGSVTLPVFTPAVGRLYRLRATVFAAVVAGAGRASRVVEAAIVRGVTPVTQVLQAASGTDAAVEAIVVAVSRDGDDVELTCTGVAVDTLNWGALVEILDLPLA